MISQSKFFKLNFSYEYDISDRHYKHPKILDPFHLFNGHNSRILSNPSSYNNQHKVSIKTEDRNNVANNITDDTYLNSIHANYTPTELASLGVKLESINPTDRDAEKYSNCTETYNHIKPFVSLIKNLYL